MHTQCRRENAKGKRMLEVTHLLFRSSQIADAALRRTTVRVKLTARQVVLLNAVVENPHASQTQLVDILGIDRSTLSSIVRRLAGAGLVEQERSAEDGRELLVSATTEGRRRLRTALIAVDSAPSKDSLAPLGAGEKEVLIALLKRIVGHHNHSNVPR